MVNTLAIRTKAEKYFRDGDKAGLKLCWRCNHWIMGEKFQTCIWCNKKVHAVSCDTRVPFFVCWGCLVVQGVLSNNPDWAWTWK